LTLTNQKYFDDDYGVRVMSTTAADDDNDNDLPHPYCYWLCNREAELKVYTDFGNILHLCKQCYEIYDPFHRLKTTAEEIDGARLVGTKS
jgi:hypothetical protein